MMNRSREIRLEELLGRPVWTASGRPVGRIEEVTAEPEGEDYVVRNVIVGDTGFRARLFSIAAQLPTFRSLGFGGRYRTRAIPWEWLDFSDPEHPRFIEAGGER